MTIDWTALPDRPWTVMLFPPDTWAPYILDRDGEVVLALEDATAKDTAGQVALAHVCAAVPELYAAVRELVTTWDHKPSQLTRLEAAFAAARAALVKAEGWQP